MKKLCGLLIIILIFFSGAINVSAEDNYDELLEQSKANEIVVPEGSKEFIRDNNITLEEPLNISTISPKKIMDYIWHSFQSTLNIPLKLLGGILAVILFSALMTSVSDSIKNENINKIYDIVSVLVCVGIISNPITDVIITTSSTLVEGGNFMLSYIPIFSSILASSGNITSASSYNCIVLIVAQFFVQIANLYLLPILGFCMALAIVESINPTISLSGITNGLKKVCIWGIGFIMTIFVGMLTIQSIVGTSADSVAIKAGKFVVSSLVPVVGKSISDAYTTIKGSLGLLRSGVGSFGIIALVLTVLPAILTLASVQLAVAVGNIVSDIFGVKQIHNLLKNVSSVLSIAMSLLLVFSLMLIISTTVVMLVGMNIG